MSDTTNVDADVQAQLDTLAVEIADLKARVSHLELEGGLSYTKTSTEPSTE